MEDAVFMKEINHLDQKDRVCGVFDGHGGPDIALMCQCVFPHVFQWNINKLSHGYSDDKTVRIYTALKKTLRDMDQVIMTPEG